MENTSAVISERWIAALNEVFAAKHHSLARYVAEARPYVAPGREAALREIELIGIEDEIDAARLAEAIERMEGIPQSGLYDSSVAELNYLSLEHLINVLTKAREKELLRYGSMMDELKGTQGQGAESILREILAATALQVERLYGLASASKAR